MGPGRRQALRAPRRYSGPWVPLRAQLLPTPRPHRQSRVLGEGVEYCPRHRTTAHVRSADKEDLSHTLAPGFPITEKQPAPVRPSSLGATASRVTFYSFHLRREAPHCHAGRLRISTYKDPTSSHYSHGVTITHRRYILSLSSRRVKFSDFSGDDPGTRGSGPTSFLGFSVTLQRMYIAEPGGKGFGNICGQERRGSNSCGSRWLAEVPLFMIFTYVIQSGG